LRNLSASFRTAENGGFPGDPNQIPDPGTIAARRPNPASFPGILESWRSGQRIRPARQCPDQEQVTGKLPASYRRIRPAAARRKSDPVTGDKSPVKSKLRAN